MSDLDIFGEEPRRHRASRTSRRASGGRGRRRRGHRRRRRKSNPLAPLIALVVIAVFVGGAGYVGYTRLRDYLIPPDYPGSGSGSVVIHIQRGDTATAVAQIIQQKGVVKSARAFVKAVEATSANLMPGFYRLRLHMRASAALELLLDPKSRVIVRVTIPEGWRVSRILATFAKQTGIPLAQFQQAAQNPADLGLPPYAHGHLEGYLFPATYDIDPTMTATDVLRTMVHQFDVEAEQLHLVAGARRLGLDPGQVVTVASLVQAEGGRHSDFPKIAEVVYNRLRNHDRLQLDSTVMYALNKYGIVADSQELQVDSPYNTYRVRGLPPGPIGAPGAAAIEAALNPQQGNWYYFVTTDPQRRITQFTADPAEFERLKQELYRNMGHG